MQVNIYRIVQEQLNIIVSNAAATSVNINLTCYKTSVVMVISDNGQGWDFTNATWNACVTSIKSRAEQYNGNVTIITKPGQGCTLKVMLYFNSDIHQKTFLQAQIINLAPAGIIREIPADFMP